MLQENMQDNLILYADDDSDDLEQVQSAFDQFSCKVKFKTFPNGSEILSYLSCFPENEGNPCLIILDINMPIITGKDVLRDLRAINRFAHVPIVLFTTSSSEPDRKYAEFYHAGFITKSIVYGGLAKIADQFINECEDKIQDKIRKCVTKE